MDIVRSYGTQESNILTHEVLFVGVSFIYHLLFHGYSTIAWYPLQIFFSTLTILLYNHASISILFSRHTLDRNTLMTYKCFDLMYNFLPNLTIMKSKMKFRPTQVVSHTNRGFHNAELIYVISGT